MLAYLPCVLFERRKISFFEKNTVPLSKIFDHWIGFRRTQMNKWLHKYWALGWGKRIFLSILMKFLSRVAFKIADRWAAGAVRSKQGQLWQIYLISPSGCTADHQSQPNDLRGRFAHLFLAFRYIRPAGKTWQSRFLEKKTEQRHIELPGASIKC